MKVPEILQDALGLRGLHLAGLEVPQQISLGTEGVTAEVTLTSDGHQNIFMASIEIELAHVDRHHSAMQTPYTVDFAEPGEPFARSVYDNVGEGWLLAPGYTERLPILLNLADRVEPTLANRMMHGFNQLTTAALVDRQWLISVRARVPNSVTPAAFVSTVVSVTP